MVWLGSVGLVGCAVVWLGSVGLVGCAVVWLGSVGFVGCAVVGPSGPSVVLEYENSVLNKWELDSYKVILKYYVF